MGLDMYLYLRFPEALPPDPDRGDEWGSETEYVSAYEHRTVPEQQRFADIVGLLGAQQLFETQSPWLEIERDGTVSLCIAYWRKANAIHRWFVEHCQDGVDECQPSNPVHVEQLAQLIQLCRAVISDPTRSEELLPPLPGFFFGSTDIDQWYIEDLEYTAKRLEKVVQAVLMRKVERPGEDLTFIYQSSW